MMRRIAGHLIKPRRPRLLLATLALAVTAATAAAVLVERTPMGSELERASVNARYDARGAVRAPTDVVVVAIDRRQEALLSQWPINRASYAAAIDNLDQAGVAGIAIATPMDYPAQNPTEDAIFERAIKRATAPVVLTHTARDAVTWAGEPPVSGRLVGEAGVIPASGLATTLVRKAGQSGASAASGEARRDADTVNFLGGRGTIEQLSFADVSLGLAQQADLRGKLVVIGPTEGAGRDDVSVPVGGGSLSRAELEATAVTNLLDGTMLRTPPAWVAIAAAAALTLLVWGLLLVVPLWAAVPGSLAAIAAWVWVSVAAFDRGVQLPLVTPALAGVAAFGSLTLALSVLSVRDRRRVKGLFARYVPAAVVRELVDSEDRIELGGEEREITVIFSDIRGFTTLSEHAEAAEMVSQLNEYFEAMVAEVAAHDGTVDKFLGDGLMAIFGAPVSRVDHAARACRAALAMLDRLEHVNRGREARGLAPLRIGIGVHTGVAVVGNVGSPPFRVDFTAIGDTVNLAARVEATTKELGCELVVTRATADAAVSTDPDLAALLTSLGSVVVRGRSEPTELLALGSVGTEARARDAA
jgi:adenylate cyclase